jgi:phage tail-like protein
MAAATQQDPITNYLFSLEIEGMSLAFFKSVSGIDSSVEVVTNRSSTPTGKIVTTKVPGQISYGDITFSRGMCKDMALQKWHDDILAGKIDESRKNGSLVLYDYKLGELARWNFERAWPSKISMSGVEAGSNEVIVEELTLAVEKIVRAK